MDVAAFAKCLLTAIPSIVKQYIGSNLNISITLLLSDPTSTTLIDTEAPFGALNFSSRVDCPSAFTKSLARLIFNDE